MDIVCPPVGVIHLGKESLDVLGGLLPFGQGTLNELPHTVSDHKAVVIYAVYGEPVVRKNFVTGVPKICKGLYKSPVQIEYCQFVSVHNILRLTKMHYL